MEMKINFTKLFNFQDTASQSKQNSFHYDEPSFQSSHLPQEYKYHGNRQMQYANQQYHSVNILQDFSTINRSLERSLDKSLQKSQQNKSTSSHLKSQSGRYKMPGQRLYYESQMDFLRKQKQLQRLKVEMISEQNKQITFKPVINQKSKKIAEKLIESPKPIKKTQTVSYINQRQEQEIKNCTFKPHLITKDKYNFNKTGGQRSKTQVFQHLYNDHKVKQMKMKLNMQSQQYLQKKKLTKGQLQQFFQRNQDYIQKQNKKHEMVKHVSHNYDLTSGRKLFSPKIQKQTPLFKSTSSRNLPSSAKNLPSSDRNNVKRSELNNQKKVNLFNKMSIQQSKPQLNYFSMESKKLFNKIQYQKDEMEQHGCFQEKPTSQKLQKSIHDSINRSEIIEQVQQDDHINQLNQQPPNAFYNKFQNQGQPKQQKIQEKGQTVHQEQLQGQNGQDEQNGYNGQIIFNQQQNIEAIQKNVSQKSQQIQNDQVSPIKIAHLLNKSHPAQQQKQQPEQQE